MLIPVTTHRSDLDKTPRFNPKAVKATPKEKKVRLTACHESRKTRMESGDKPVDATVIFGKISRSPRYAWPNAPRRAGAATTRNADLGMG